MNPDPAVPTGMPGAATRPLSSSPRVDAAIAAFQAGDATDEAFRVVFDAYFPAIRRFFARKGLPPQDCLDLTQETFVGIYRGLATFRRDARFETWLFKIATTTFLKRLRAGATDKRRGDDVATDDVAHSEPALTEPGDQLDRVVEAEDRARLRAAITDLPEQMKQCLTLRLYHELKYREIATVMRLSIETVKVHLFEARKRLRQRFADHPSRATSQPRR